AIVQPSQPLLLEGVEVPRRRPSHDVEAVTVLERRTRGHRGRAVACPGVRVEEAEVMTELVADCSQRHVTGPVDPGPRGIAADSRGAPKSTGGAFGESVDAVGVAGKINPCGGGGGLRMGRDTTRVARRAVERDDVPADDIAGQPG